MSLAEAIAGIDDGSKLITGGVHFSNTPLALVRELIRRRVRDLEIIPTPATGLWVDMLLAAGAVRKLWVSYIGMEFMGLAHNFRRAVEAGTVEIVDVDEPTIFLGLRAAAGGLPFVAMPPIHKLTDLPKVSPEVYRDLVDPFTGRTVIATPPLAPDWAFIHVAKADVYGNGVSLGGRHMEDVIAKASKHVVLSAEEIVENDVITAAPTQTTVPGVLVEAVVHAPYGAYPGTCPGVYSYDRAHLEEYSEYAKDDRTGAYLERYVYGSQGDRALLDAAGPERLAALELK
ncbi:MAG: CoA-transferase [Candidatus Lustribacter sp.]|jgi:glutaconate CoA-transferase subunit A